MNLSLEEMRSVQLYCLGTLQGPSKRSKGGSDLRKQSQLYSFTRKTKFMFPL